MTKEKNMKMTNKTRGIQGYSRQSMKSIRASILYLTLSFLSGVLCTDFILFLIVDHALI